MIGHAEHLYREALEAFNNNGKIDGLTGYRIFTRPKRNEFVVYDDSKDFGISLGILIFSYKKNRVRLQYSANRSKWFDLPVTETLRELIIVAKTRRRLMSK